VKITITSSSNTTAFVLADDTVSVVIGANFAAGTGGQVMEGFVNKQKRAGQKSLLFRAPYLLNVPRFNLENRLAFTVQRSFQTVEACVAFISFHPDNVPVQGEIAITNQSTTGLITRFLPNAVVESVECTRHSGLSCNFRYSICGNGAWQTSP
jgi:hypothetical protein